MNSKELAQELNGSEYGFNVSLDLLKRNSDLVVVFGASDDLMEFRGAIHDEIGCFGGGTAYLDKDGLIESKCDDEDCPYFKKEKEKAITVEAIWCDDAEDIAWIYKTDIPCEVFLVLEGEEVFCRVIVFNLSDVYQIQKAQGKA